MTSANNVKLKKQHSYENPVSDFSFASRVVVVMVVGGTVFQVTLCRSWAQLSTLMES